MECWLRPWVSWHFLQNNNQQVVKKMEWIENRKIRKNPDENLDVEHSSYDIALGSTDTQKVI